jgi:HPt (histidine-containing phosphotransfer) domain-containing protein
VTFRARSTNHLVEGFHLSGPAGSAGGEPCEEVFMSEAGTRQAAPVDWEEGLARAGDDVDFFRELIELFLSDVPTRLATLDAAIAAGDAAAAAGAAHSIKGAAANLSAQAVQQKAYQLEHTAREGDLEELPGLTEELRTEIERLESFAKEL